MPTNKNAITSAPAPIISPKFSPDQSAGGDKFYRYPTSSASDLITKALFYGDDIDRLPNQSNNVSRRNKLSIRGTGKARALTYKSADDKIEISITISDLDDIKGSKGKNPTLDLFVYALIKINEQVLKSGRDHISFPLQELVDEGLYKSKASARKGFLKGADGLTSVKVKGTDKSAGNKIEARSDKIAVLFTSGDIDRGLCKLYLNDQLNYSFLAQYFTLLPRYYFSLPLRAKVLLLYIFFLARQNTKKIKESGHFNISFRSIQARLNLPSEINNTNPGRTIKDEIENAVEKIEEAHSAYYGSSEKTGEPDFQLLLHKADGSITDYLDRGYLEVTLKGAFAEDYIKISSEQEKKITSEAEKRESRKEQAIIKRLADSMKKEEENQ